MKCARWAVHGIVNLVKHLHKIVLYEICFNVLLTYYFSLYSMSFSSN